MRLTLVEGGSGQWFYIRMMNDTGSDIMTMFDTDFAQLGDLTFYFPLYDRRQINNANEFIEFLYTIDLEVQLVRESGEPWSEIFLERALIRQPFGVHRLSGLGLRHNFFIGTGPGFDRLSMANTKGGMSSMLQ